MADINNINLIPNDFFEEKKSSQFIIRGIIIISCLFFSFFTLFSFSYYRFNRLKNDVSAIQSEMQKAKNIEKQITLKYANIDQLLKRRKILFDLIKHSYFTPILYNLANTISHDSKLTSLYISSNDRKNNNSYNLRLSGISKSYNDLSIFLSTLQENRFFKDIILKTSSIEDKKKFYINFELAMNYQKP